MGDTLDVDWERSTDQRTVLRLAGGLRPGWCGKLATGLARRGIDIERGHARIVAAGRWEASFQLHCLPGSEPPGDEIVRSLNEDLRDGFMTPIVLDAFALRTSEARGGCLRLDVEAPDRLGFLAALLRRLAFFSLFPSEVEIETVGGRARDRLWLRAAGDRTPLPRTTAAVRASLEALVRKPGERD
ncbi:MAG: hypothetical protein ACQGVC_14875 [Myxococcota bacterium]